MQQHTSLTGWIRNYLVCGALWCLVINVHAFLTGAPPPLMAASGPSTGAAKAFDVARILAGQVALWPFDLWEKVIRPTFG